MEGAVSVIFLKFSYTYNLILEMIVCTFKLRFFKANGGEGYVTIFGVTLYVVAISIYVERFFKENK